MQLLNPDGTFNFTPVGRDRNGRHTGRPSRGQRAMLGRYKKHKRKPIMERKTFDGFRFHEEWIHPTKGKRRRLLNE